MGAGRHKNSSHRCDSGTETGEPRQRLDQNLLYRHSLILRNVQSSHSATKGFRKFTEHALAQRRWQTGECGGVDHVTATMPKQSRFTVEVAQRAACRVAFGGGGEVGCKWRFTQQSWHKRHFITEEQVANEGTAEFGEDGIIRVFSFRKLAPTITSLQEPVDESDLMLVKELG